MRDIINESTGLKFSGKDLHLNGKLIAHIVGQRKTSKTKIHGFYLWSPISKKTFGQKTDKLGGQFAYVDDLIKYIKANEQEIIKHFTK